VPSFSRRFRLSTMVRKMTARKTAKLRPHKASKLRLRRYACKHQSSITQPRHCGGMVLIIVRISLVNRRPSRCSPACSIRLRRPRCRPSACWMAFSAAHLRLVCYTHSTHSCVHLHARLTTNLQEVAPRLVARSWSCSRRPTLSLRCQSPRLASLAPAYRHQLALCLCRSRSPRHSSARALASHRRRS